MSRPSLVPESKELPVVCEQCGEHVHDEFSCLTCSCGIFFSFTVVKGNLVRPSLPLNE